MFYSRFYSIALVLGWISVGSCPAVVISQYDNEFSGYENRNFPRAITADASGNAYVAIVDTCCGNSANLVLSKYGPTGLIWQVRDTGGEYYAKLDIGDMIIDKDGHIVVFGETSWPSPTGYDAEDFYLVKYNTSGTRLTNAIISGTAGDAGSAYSGPAAAKIQMDATGNLYLAGLSSPVVKVDKNFNVLWKSDTEIDMTSVAGLVVDTSGNSYVAGGYYTSDSSAVGVLVKYDANGRQIWSKEYTTPYDGVALQTLEALIKVDDNSLYATCDYLDPADSQYKSTFLKFDANGNVVIEKPLSSPSPEMIYQGGYIYRLAYDDVTKHDLSGNAVWTGTGNGHLDMTLDSAGNVYSVGFDDASQFYTAKHTGKNGRLEWSRSETLEDTSSSVANFIAVSYPYIYSAGTTPYPSYEPNTLTVLYKDIKLRGN